MAECREYDVLIVGAGPAGLAAATAATGSKPGLRVGIVDDNRSPGGQIWRAGVAGPSTFLRGRLGGGVSDAEQLLDTRIIACPIPSVLLAEASGKTLQLSYRRLILCTGARERFLPFPGWTLPGVMGAGGLQALAKGGWPIAGKRVVVAGSGPLLLAVAAYLRKTGAKVLCVVEQAPTAAINRFARTLAWRYPGKFAQGLWLRGKLLGVSYRTGCWPTEAHGREQLEGVRLQDERGRSHDLQCDYLACGFGLVPNTELAHLLGCRIKDGRVAVDERLETTVSGIFAAGELTGIGGLDKSIAEGIIAGCVAAGVELQANWVRPRQRAHAFAHLLDEAFALRPELKSLATDETLICRCEDVPLGQLRPYTGWRGAKLQTRCGMGPCQGRVCGPITEFLLSWPAASVRPPILPARLGSLCPNAERSST